MLPADRSLCAAQHEAFGWAEGEHLAASQASGSYGWSSGGHLVVAPVQGEDALIVVLVPVSACVSANEGRGRQSTHAVGKVAKETS